ncbi:FitA-like ribbon-helix-helix domain-containing protein [Corynebacterium stercoris]|uniref:FitA-like ribbon-helix-helix domain-containing protein n=1 Tax=Corynebacterium stercoris TaxID=2943490 RepID=UPI003F59E2B9
MKRRLAAQAKRNGRSMEAEARHLLDDGTKPPNLGLALYEASRDIGGVHLQIPPREGRARAADLS